MQQFFVSFRLKKIAKYSITHPSNPFRLHWLLIPRSPYLWKLKLYFYCFLCSNILKIVLFMEELNLNFTALIYNISITIGVFKSILMWQISENVCLIGAGNKFQIFYVLSVIMFLNDNIFRFLNTYLSPILVWNKRSKILFLTMSYFWNCKMSKCFRKMYIYLENKPIIVLRWL